MSDLYARVASTSKGARALSAARLRYQVIKILYRALERSGLNQVDLARRLGIRKSAVNQVFRGDGNVRISTLAEYLHEMGLEIQIEVVPLGRQRAAAVRELEETWHSSREVTSQLPSTFDTPSWEGDVDHLPWRISTEARRKLAPSG